MGRKDMDVKRFDRKMAPDDSPTGGLEWRHGWEEPFYLAGFPWFEKDGVYRRLPVDLPEAFPEAVDSLADCTAGGQVRFQSDTTRLAVRVRLPGPADMVHMPATGQCGFDLYIGPAGKQRYYNTAKYDLKESQYEVLLFEHKAKEMRNFALNFPLYKGVDEMRVGVEPGAEILPPPAYSVEGPIVIYGTSITQGGCASRPGSAYTNILSRRLNAEVVNLGFSGSGKGEPEVARVISLIPHPSLLVLDYDANCHGLENLRRTLPEFIRILRGAHPGTPLLVISRIPAGSEHVQEYAAETRIERLEIQRDVVQGFREEGDERLFFQEGSVLLGENWDECTVDGSHPTDLGFMRMADSLEPVFRRILGL